MVVIPRFGAEADPDYPKHSPPRPTPVSSATPTATDIASVTTSTASSPASSSTSDAPGFLHIATDGASGDKILHGFLIGMAIGIIVSFVLCCWLPCCRKKRRSRLQRRNDNIRRRLVVLEDEAWVNQNWPQRRPWDVGEDESQSQSQSQSQSHVSHD